MDVLKTVGCFFMIYIVICIAAYPKQTEYCDCIELPLWLRLILFLPIALGHGRDFRICIVPLQVANLLLWLIYAFMKLLVPARLDAFYYIFWTALPFSLLIGLTWHIIHGKRS